MKLFNQYRGLRREIYILFFGRIVTNLGSMIWPVMTMILSQKLGLSATEISYFFVGSSIISLPSNIIGGKLADKYNKKRIIIICDSISVICFIVCAIIPLGIGTVLIFIFAGIFQSMEYPSYDALFADMTLTKDRERAYSLDYLGGNLGLVLSPTIAGLLFKDYLWLSFLVSGISIALSTLLIGLLIKDITPVEDTSEEASYQENKEGVGIFRILRENPMLLLFLLSCAFYYGAYGQYNFIMPLDMANVHGDRGAVLFGTVSSLNCITVVIFTPIITKLFKKLRETDKMITGRVLVLIGYIVFLLLLGFIPGYYIAMLIFTWGEIFSTISEGTYMSTRIPASHRGRINGIMTVFGMSIHSAIDVLVGKVYDRAGSTTTWMCIFVIVIISVLLSGIIMVRDKKAYPKLYSKKEEN